MRKLTLAATVAALAIPALAQAGPTTTLTASPSPFGRNLRLTARGHVQVWRSARPVDVDRQDINLEPIRAKHRRVPAEAYHRGCQLDSLGRGVWVRVNVCGAGKPLRLIYVAIRPVPVPIHVRFRVEAAP